MVEDPSKAARDPGTHVWRYDAGGRLRGGEGSRITGRVIFGLVVMFLGILWTLDNLDLVESEPILEWWPVVIMAVGLAKLFGVGTSRHVPWGIVFTAVGFLLLANNVGVIVPRIWHLWPLALVFVGIALISRSMSPRPLAGAPADDRSAVIHSFAMWSGATRKVTSQGFQGGDVTAVMGGVELDLRGAHTAPGGAVLDVFIWWGGIDLTVPENMRVLNEATVLMGGIEDKSKVPPPEATDTVILRGLVVMGGIEIKN